MPSDLAEKMDSAFDRMKMIPLDRFSFENVIQYFEFKYAEYHEKTRVGSWLEKIASRPVISSEAIASTRQADTYSYCKKELNKKQNNTGISENIGAAI